MIQVQVSMARTHPIERPSSSDAGACHETCRTANYDPSIATFSCGFTFGIQDVFVWFPAGSVSFATLQYRFDTCG